MHERVISLQRVDLEGRPVSASQAFLTWRQVGHRVTWNGRARLSEEPVHLPPAGEEISLDATSLDGRRIAGRVVITDHGNHETPLAFTGSGVVRSPLKAGSCRRNVRPQPRSVLGAQVGSGAAPKAETSINDWRTRCGSLKDVAH